jgi:hypothetical protein
MNKTHKIKCFVGLLILFVYATGYAGDPKISGGMADDLSLTVAFVPTHVATNEYFIITLTNKTGDDLNVQVQSKAFHGSIIITSKAKEVEYYPKDFLKMLLTSEWPEPTQKLERDSTIIWKVPIVDLRDIHDNRISAEEINGTDVCAKLNLIAIVPPNRTYIISNAKQISPKVKIHLEPK